MEVKKRECFYEERLVNNLQRGLIYIINEMFLLDKQEKYGIILKKDCIGEVLEIEVKLYWIEE